MSGALTRVGAAAVKVYSIMYTAEILTLGSDSMNAYVGRVKKL